MRNIILILVLIGVSFLAACNRPINSAGEIKGEITTIKSSANDIDFITENAPKVKERTDTIRQSADNLSEYIGQLNSDNTKVLDKMKKDNEKLAEDLKKEKDKNNALLKKGLYGIITFSTILLGIFIALAILGNPKVITFAVIAGSVILACLAVLTAIQYMIYVGIGFGVLLTGGLIYYAIIYRKANKEITKNIDTGIKAGVIDKDKFSKIANDEKMGQSKSTKLIVDKNQGKKIKGFWGLIK